MLILGSLLWTTTGAGVAPPPPAPPAPEVIPSGGFPARELREALEGRSWRDKLKEQPIQEHAIQAIEQIAYRQAQSLELDKQKRFEDLSRELQIREIEWDSRYLELLNQRREALIDQEIGLLLRQKRDDDDIQALVLMASYLL
ncbi:MAG: hypothetical protein ACRD2L_10700 [Terriglobia bacterium]